MSERLSAEHEQLGEIAAGIISRYARTLEEARVCSTATPGDLEKMFDEPLPRAGIDSLQLFARFEREIAPHAMNISSPRYYGQFNPTPLPVAVWADALCSAINQNGAIWRNSPTASVIEARVIRWLCEIIGYGAESFGTLASGGSEANLIALKCARDRASEFVRDKGLRAASWPPARTNGDASTQTATQGNMIVYASEQCHYSFVKSVDILGLGRENLRKVATDERFHIRLDELRRAIEQDLEAGHLPICIAGAAGTTSTGVIDPLDQLADIAREYKIWFHVDAAYGGALRMSEKYRDRLRGIERADSVTLDPHKWMFVPFAAGALLVREGGHVLRDAFDITPEYLSEERGGQDVPFDFFRYGQLGTRRFNALKIWFALKTLGTDGYAEIIERQIELTRYLAARIAELVDFECVGEVETAVCCVRFVPAEMRAAEVAEVNGVQQELQQRIERSGEAWLATTVLHGRRVLRVNVNSFLTERRHIDDLVELLRSESTQLWKARRAI
ncbi:MAG TPA: aspartate aminotransferase family protein [Pyrinomonadaceae bacterium]|jgi:aromatic-L-amino-acid decarboxylase